MGCCVHSHKCPKPLAEWRLFGSSGSAHPWKKSRCFAVCWIRLPVSGISLKSTNSSYKGYGTQPYGETETLDSHNPWWECCCYEDFGLFTFASLRLRWWMWWSPNWDGRYTDTSLILWCKYIYLYTYICVSTVGACACVCTNLKGILRFDPDFYWLLVLFLTELWASHHLTPTPVMSHHSFLLSLPASVWKCAENTEATAGPHGKLKSSHLKSLILWDKFVNDGVRAVLDHWFLKTVFGMVKAFI